MRRWRGDPRRQRPGCRDHPELENGDSQVLAGTPKAEAVSVALRLRRLMTSGGLRFRLAIERMPRLPFKTLGMTMPRLSRRHS